MANVFTENRQPDQVVMGNAGVLRNSARSTRTKKKCHNLIVSASNDKLKDKHIDRRSAISYKLSLCKWLPTVFTDKEKAKGFPCHIRERV